MKRTALMFGTGTLALVLTDCGSLADRDCGACCKGVDLSGSAAYAWEESK